MIEQVAPAVEVLEPVRGRTRAALISLAGSYLGSALTIVKGILFVPLYLRMFGTDVYGAWLATGNIVGLLGLADAGITNVAYQKLSAAWGAGARKRFCDLAAAAVALIAGVGAAIAAAGIALCRWVPGLIHAPASSQRELSVAFLLAACGAAGTVAVSCLIAIPTSWQRTEIGAASRLLGQLIETALIALGLWRRWGVISLGLGAVAGALGSCALCALWTLSIWRRLALDAPRLHGAGVLELARSAAPLMVSRVVLQIDGNIEVALVSAFISPAAAAVYGITDRIFRTAVGFINPLAGSLVGALSHYVGERGRTAALAPSRELIAIWSLIVAASLPPLLAVNGDFTQLWVGAANYGGLALSSALLINEVLGAREWLFSVVLLATGAIAISAWSATVECLVRMPIMYIAIQRIGWLGLPLAQAGASVLALAAQAWFVGAQFERPRRERASFFNQGGLALVVSFGAGALEARLLPSAATWSGLALKCAAVGVFHLALALLLAPAGRRTLLERLVSGRFPMAAKLIAIRAKVPRARDP